MACINVNQKQASTSLPKINSFVIICDEQKQKDQFHYLNTVEAIYFEVLKVKESF